MRAAVVLCFILSLISLISLRGGLCTCTSLPTDNNNIHYNSTLTPAKGGFSSATYGMAAELSKSIIDDRHRPKEQALLHEPFVPRQLQIHTHLRAPQ